MRSMFQHAAVLIAVALLAAPAIAQDRPKVRGGSLTLPVLAPLVMNVMKEKGLDAKHGFDLEIKPYPSIAAYYAALATGEIDALMGGPTVMQKLRTEGAPVRIAATGLRLSDLVIMTTNPAIRSLADLKGKQLAADMGSGQYQVVSIYARSKGLSMGSDITVVNANFGLARSQLAASRVDAAMVIEPIATLMLRENKNLKIIFNGATAWKEVTGNEGWELVLSIREDFSKKGDLPRRLIAAMQDVAALMRSNLDEVDAIAARTIKLPAGVLKDAVSGKRLELDVQPAWGPEKKVIWDMFERAVAAKFLDKMPDDGIIYAP